MFFPIIVFYSSSAIYNKTTYVDANSISLKVIHSSDDIPQLVQWRARGRFSRLDFTEEESLSFS